MNLFYVPHIVDAKIAYLDENESRHCTMVMRHELGDEIAFTDGRGNLFHGTISEIKKKKVTVKIFRHQEYQQMPYHLHIAIAPTKQIDRMEWFVEKATEIGVSAITPLICVHSERKVIRTDRLKKIATSAMKQSLKMFKPQINEPVAFEKFIDTQHTGDNFIAHCNHQIDKFLYSSIKSSKQYLILIGPEGDFSEHEVKQAIRAGYKEISLGNSRLRTETAGIVACHSVALKNQ